MLLQWFWLPIQPLSGPFLNNATGHKMPCTCCKPTAATNSDDMDQKMLVIHTPHILHSVVTAAAFYTFQLSQCGYHSWTRQCFGHDTETSISTLCTKMSSLYQLRQATWLSTFHRYQTRHKINATKSVHLHDKRYVCTRDTIKMCIPVVWHHTLYSQGVMSREQWDLIMKLTDVSIQGHLDVPQKIPA